ncbi:very short patch repair endonuclease [Aquisalimonas sp. APHAB1-3]|uniref:very short patch repair endonuclease n=1 Tax=Aquisalimonas sp. APHAB1-3 TaxID=3402080 RepID=UPI003AAF64A0
MDIFDARTRSRVMSRIRSKNTKPEVWVRKSLFALGFRYRLHGGKRGRKAGLPGSPDLVFPKFGAVIFINGCFWHGHDCHLFKPPKTRPDVWREKMDTNRRRDRRNVSDLRRRGWRVLVIWECALRGKTRSRPEAVIETAANWLLSGGDMYEIKGMPGLAPKARPSTPHQGDDG